MRVVLLVLVEAEKVARFDEPLPKCAENDTV